MEIFKQFRFEAAHSLPCVPEGHKCGRVHGHNYRVDVHVVGPVLKDGFVIDFADISGVVKPSIAKLDHTSVNETIPNPTAENIAVWLWGEIASVLPGLARITVWETDDCGAVYTGTGATS